MIKSSEAGGGCCCICESSMRSSSPSVTADRGISCEPETLSGARALVLERRPASELLCKDKEDGGARSAAAAVVDSAAAEPFPSICISDGIGEDAGDTEAEADCELGSLVLVL
jgi:hypothetical protein